MGRSRSRSPVSRNHASAQSHSDRDRKSRGYVDQRSDRGYDKDRAGYSRDSRDSGGRNKGRDFDRRSRRSHSHDRSRRSSSTPPRKRHMHDDRPAVADSELVGKSEDEIAMLRTMGFCTFDSTKDSKVKGNVGGDVHVVVKRKYRQYMNRKGGFNRPLDFVT